MLWFQVLVLSYILILRLVMISAQNDDIPYPVDQKVIDNLQDATVAPVKTYLLKSSMSQADNIVSRLRWKNHTAWTRAQNESAERIELWKPYLKRQQTNYTVCFQAFQDFDRVFFADTLTKNIHMSVKARPEDHLTYWGWTESNAKPRVTINLNSASTNATRPSPVNELLSLVLHEMAHSYFDLTSVQDENVSPEGGHGPSLLKILCEFQVWMNTNKLDIDVLDGSREYMADQGITCYDVL